MAWSAPPAFTVSQIVTAAQMTVLSDDLNYLKGNAGNVQFSPADYLLDASGATTGAPRNLGIAWGTGAAGRFYFGDNLTCLQNNTGGKLVMQSYHGMVLAGARGSGTPRGFTTGGATGDTSVLIEAIGTGPVLQATGAGGGMLYVSATAVGAAVQTPVVAGTIGVMAMIWGMIRNNGGSTVPAFLGAINGNGYALGQSSITNVSTTADQVTITVTAGGAITLQRTNGANTHEVNLIVLYK